MATLITIMKNKEISLFAVEDIAEKIGHSGGVLRVLDCKSEPREENKVVEE